MDFFFIKEDHPNYSMLEESLPAYLLYKYTLNRTFLFNIKVKCFIVKLISFKSTTTDFNLSLTGKLPVFLCLTVAAEIKTNEWTEIELYKLT